jgi:hypothetical protein
MEGYGLSESGTITLKGPGTIRFQQADIEDGYDTLTITVYADAKDNSKGADGKAGKKAEHEPQVIVVTGEHRTPSFPIFVPLNATAKLTWNSDFMVGRKGFDLDFYQNLSYQELLWGTVGPEVGSLIEFRKNLYIGFLQEFHENVREAVSISDNFLTV